jgi:DNA-binding CsgD family transcriptional regulator
MGLVKVVPQTENRAPAPPVRVAPPGSAATTHRRDEIARVYQSGKTLEATGAMFGITRERVRQILAGVGVPSRRKDRFPTAWGDRVARLYQRGETIEAAGRAVGVSAFTARKMLVERGIERRSGVSSAYRKPSTRRRHELMVRLYRQGKTFKELANAFETSTTSVQRVLNRLGIERRGRGRSSTGLRAGISRPTRISSIDDVVRVDRQVAESGSVQL